MDARNILLETKIGSSSNQQHQLWNLKLARGRGDWTIMVKSFIWCWLVHLVLDVQPFLVESRSFETQVASSPLQSSQDLTSIVIWGVQQNLVPMITLVLIVSCVFFSRWFKGVIDNNCMWVLITCRISYDAILMEKTLPGKRPRMVQLQGGPS